MEDFKKRNNSKDGELQPYDPDSGEYEEMDSNESKNDEIEKNKEKEFLEDLKYIGNYYARRLGGTREEFPLKFPKPEYPIEYKHYFFNNEINWRDIIVSKEKMLFLIDIHSSKKRFLIFRNLLGYDENNIEELREQLLFNACQYKVFVQKKFDEYGFRVKIYMPIKFANSDKKLIIRTCWLIDENEKPRFVTALYDSDFERDLRDEI